MPSIKQKQFLLSFPERVDMSAENFLVLPTNQLAFMSVKQFPQCAGDVLVLYGKEGVGKSHLVAIHQANAKVRVLLAEQLKLPLDLSSQHYAVDGIDRLTKSQQEALFHLFNYVKSIGGSLLITSQKPVANMDILPDLKSRLLTAPQVEIEPPKDAHLEVFAVKYASDRQIFLEPKVVAYILKNAERNVTFIEDVIKKLDNLSLEQKRKITTALVREVLGLS